MVAEAIKGVLRHNDLQVLLMAAQDNRNNAQKRNKLHQIETVIPARHRVIIKAAHPDKGQVRSRLLLIEVILLASSQVLVREAEQTKHNPAQLTVQTAGTTTGIHQTAIGLMEETVEILIAAILM